MSVVVHSVIPTPSARIYTGLLFMVFYGMSVVYHLNCHSLWHTTRSHNCLFRFFLLVRSLPDWWPTDDNTTSPFSLIHAHIQLFFVHRVAHFQLSMGTIVRGFFFFMCFQWKQWPTMILIVSKMLLIISLFFFLFCWFHDFIRIQVRMHFWKKTEHVIDLVKISFTK